MSFEILDPTHESGPPEFKLAARLTSLEGKTVGIISNGKKNTIPFFDALEKELRETHGAADVIRVTKSNYSAPADPHIMEQVPKWDALVAGIGD